MKESKFKVGDTVYWIEYDEEAPYNGYDDPSDWIVKGKVVSTYNAIEGEGVESYPMYIVYQEAAPAGETTDYLSEDALFSDVSSIYDSVIKNLTEHVAELHRALNKLIKKRGDLTKSHN